MTVDRLTRVNELLRREIGGALHKLLGGYEIDLSAVTVTHVVTSKSLRTARVLVSIRDHAKERSHMLALIRECRPQIQALINSNMILKYTPRLTFELDTSLEKGDYILGVLMEMERQDMQATEEKGNEQDSKAQQ
ncbi:MAG: 30S ribosome-binding factor RbfA [Lentisphaerae bacterium]|nr:30S ribosome-binding factor RbfA [Lentisphaerota bacterium]